MRKHYSEFANYCVRFYVVHSHRRFRTSADKKNWYAVQSALRSFSDREQELIYVLYRERDTMADNIYQLAKREQIEQDVLWKLVSDLEKNVARKRGLI